MKAGRELDALVAEKVMGLPSVRYEDQGYHFDLVYGSSSSLGIFPQVPCYSTDIFAAWDVAQKVVDLDDDNQFVVHLSRTAYQKCTVEVRYWDSSDHADPVLSGPFYVTASTAPLAICLAALRVVGHEGANQPT